MPKIPALITLIIAIMALSLAPAAAQTIPVTFHFDPPDEIDFTTLRLVGGFNGWNNADDTLIMTDPDADGVYELTTELALDQNHNYKFVMDADWGLAFTDPDNPLINTSDNNNSIMPTSDPMITYLLPRDINSLNETFVDTTQAGLPIRAIFNFRAENPIDPNAIAVTIDGSALANPAQYYDADAQEFYYQPSPPLETGMHTVDVSVTSPAGTVSRSATFERNPDLVIVYVPTDFYFDSHSSRVDFAQSIYAASVMGAFNNWNNQFDPMQDDDGDGVWEATVDLEPYEWEYKFQLNNSYWINDWDNPVQNSFGNNLIVVEADSIPDIKLLGPAQGTIYEDTLEDVTFQALLRPGVFGGGVNEASVFVNLNGNELPHTFDPQTGIVSATLNMTSGTIARVDVGFINNDGVPIQRQYTYGRYDANTGYHFVDAYDDEAYDYPAGVAVGSGDIRTFHIAATNDYNHLRFTVQMQDISDRTRLGLLITNPIFNAHAEDPLALDLQLEDWNDEGIFAVIAPPSSPYFNADRENRFQEMRDPATYGDYLLDLDADALDNDQFVFTVGLAYLDSLIGGWTQERDFVLFSYLAETDGSGDGYEITAADGGSDDIIDPDIYDAAFVRSAFWQDRILTNYIPEADPFGPMLSGLDGTGRGIQSLFGADISDSLATFGPVIRFLTPEVTFWYSDLTIHGWISDADIPTVTFNYNGTETELPVTPGDEGGTFSMDVVLEEGENVAFVSATDADGFETTTPPHYFTYAYDHDPTVTIDTSVNDRTVTLTAQGNSPDGFNLSYYWVADAANPAPLSFTPFFSSITVTVPEVDGEYYLTVLVTDGEGGSDTARRLIVADGDQVYVSEGNDHAAWIDEAIVYEIYPRSFTEQGGFAGIMERIPDMVDLGINTIWLMPIYTGPTVHGYEITDYYGFEEDYGTAAEFEDLVEELHDNDIRVILDYVVNHTSIQHPFMQNVFQYTEYSPWADFYIWDGVPGESDYEYFFDWASLPNLNHTNPDVRDYFIDVAEYWVKTYDIDGFRCDVAWGVQERSAVYWPAWRERLKNAKPEVFLQAEASSAEPVYYDNRFDSANDWELRNRIREAIDGTNTIDALDAELQRNYPDHARPFRFMENHDEVRMANSHDTQRSKLAHTILFTANGVPLIYAGGEVGELTPRNLIDWSDPDNVRPYFKRLVEIRSEYIRNPVIERLSNNLAADVYTYASLSDNDIVVTAANMRSAASEPTVDLSALGLTGTNYLSDLISGDVIEVNDGNVSAVPMALDGFQARVFYYGAQAVAIEDEDEAVQVTAFGLSQNYPNPFNPGTTIAYQLPHAAHVTLSIYDVTGREVTRLVDATKPAGSHSVAWDGNNRNGTAVASGIYFYRLQADDRFVDQKKMILLK